ncbi:dnl zinc finger domain containing protein [Colletotrichum karsti]|uniref:Dnl zinc finger domain containing protein n=1 Tax=Colletotrichum karsti TaxID=1095194 RepID=A0A9P6IC69_9PEZI|nr:dnl zinc finger domain containing protein [Colletotrichum karsti]KAF9879682.1 dnl zinc finger domain containing protein [Colletotrichum karsti]
MASRSAFTRLAPVLRQTARPSASPIMRLIPQGVFASQAPLQPAVSARLAHSIPKPKAARKAEDMSDQQIRLESNPHYQLDFTCVPCDTRSRHKVSKQGYHHGSVLITCPGCRNRHVISDHLGIFGDKKVTVEDLMREKGRLVKKGTLGEDGDIEFYPDEGAQAADGEKKDSS